MGFSFMWVVLFVFGCGAGAFLASLGSGARDKRNQQALRERDTRIAELSQCMSMADVSAMENSFRNELQAARHQFDQQLARLSAELDSERQASVEREREQEAPVVAIEDNGYVVRSQISGILKNVFMHLVRNSMDHGLEQADARTAQGKPAAGTIKLALDSANGQFNIRLSDDGRGLALARIRKIALEKGMLEQGAQSSDDDVAKCIFMAGFSTAEQVTEVSGRGVGMDAVKDFVAREGGSIRFEFVDNAVGADFRQFQTIVSLPEKSMTHVDA